MFPPQVFSQFTLWDPAFNWLDITIILDILYHIINAETSVIVLVFLHFILHCPSTEIYPVVWQNGAEVNLQDNIKCLCYFISALCMVCIHKARLQWGEVKDTIQETHRVCKGVLPPSSQVCRHSIQELDSVECQLEQRDSTWRSILTDTEGCSTWARCSLVPKKVRRKAQGPGSPYLKSQSQAKISILSNHLCECCNPFRGMNLTDI